MAVKSEIKSLGDLAQTGSVAIGGLIGAALTLPKGTKWAVVFATVNSTIANAGTNATSQTAVQIFDSTNSKVILTLGSGALADESAIAENEGDALAIIDATAGAITLQLKSVSTAARNTIRAGAVLQQAY